MLILTQSTKDMSYDLAFSHYTFLYDHLFRTYKKIHAHSRFTMSIPPDLPKALFLDVTKNSSDWGFFITPTGFNFLKKIPAKSYANYVVYFIKTEELLIDQFFQKSFLPTWIKWCKEEHEICLKALMGGRWSIKSTIPGNSFGSVMYPVLSLSTSGPLQYLIHQRNVANSTMLETLYRRFSTRYFIFPFCKQTEPIFNLF